MIGFSRKAADFMKREIILQTVTAGVILKLIKFTHLWISSSGQTKTALRREIALKLFLVI